MGFVNLKKGPSEGIENQDVLCKLCQKSRGSCNYIFGKQKKKCMITMPKLKIKQDCIVQKNLQPRDVILNSEKNINFNVNIENILLVLR